VLEGLLRFEIKELNLFYHKTFLQLCAAMNLEMGAYLRKDKADAPDNQYLKEMLNELGYSEDQWKGFMEKEVV